MTAEAIDEMARAYVHAQLHELWSRVSLRDSARRLWGRLERSERASLGGSLDTAYEEFGTAGMLSFLCGYSQLRAVVEAGYRIGFLDEMTANYLLRAANPDSAFPEDEAAAIAKSTPLVVAENPRSLFWRGQMVEVDWYAQNRLWELVFELAVAARRGAAVERELFGRTLSKTYLNKLLNRLAGLKTFPQSLVELIKSAGNGTLRLDLPPRHVRCLVVETDYVVREALASTVSRWA